MLLEAFVEAAITRKQPKRIAEEGAADDGQEFFFLIFIGVLGYDGEEWLQDAVLVGAVNIFSDVCVKECLFDRGSRCVKECILQNRKCHV